MGVPTASWLPDNVEEQKMEKAVIKDAKKIPCVIALKELVQREGAKTQRDDRNAWAAALRAARRRVRAPGESGVLSLRPDAPSWPKACPCMAL
jgi:hypothetical protein